MADLQRVDPHRCPDYSAATEAAQDLDRRSG